MAKWLNSWIVKCLNGWMFVYELSGCGFESSCSGISSLKMKNGIKKCDNKYLKRNFVGIYLLNYIKKFVDFHKLMVKVFNKNIWAQYLILNT